MQTPPMTRTGKPRPWKMVMAILVVSFLGGPCTFQRLVSGNEKIPPEDQIAQSLQNQLSILKKTIDSKDIQKLSHSFHLLMAQKILISKRLQNYEFGLGLMLVVIYSFIFTLSIRTLRRFPPSIKTFSTACLAILPVHVALGALDLAQSCQLAPATESFISSYLHDLNKIPLQEAKTLGHFGVQGTCAIQVVWTLAICIFFYKASRYLQKPENWIGT